jgi:hypothetical protein
LTDPPRSPSLTRVNWKTAFLAEKPQPEPWARAISALEDHLPAGRPLETLARACATPAQLGLLGHYLADPGDGTPPEARLGRFLAAVDDSIASLPAWIEALELLHAHLEEAGRATTLDRATGYLSCCTEALSASAACADLPAITAEMLNAYGYEG